MSRDDVVDPDDGPALAAVAARRGRELVGALEGLGHDDLAAPSALPGWSRLTIVCHLRYGAAALQQVTADALAGRPTSFYPGGRARQRPATLEPRPGESPSDVVRSYARREAELAARWHDLDPAAWATPVREPADNADLGVRTLAVHAALRATEVEVHGTDLDIGLADWSATFVRLTYPFRARWLAERSLTVVDDDDGGGGSAPRTWQLAATDGPSFLVTVERGHVTVVPADEAAGAEVIAAPARDLLALLLGRAVPPGAASFAAAFRGP